MTERSRRPVMYPTGPLVGSIGVQDRCGVARFERILPPGSGRQHEPINPPLTTSIQTQDEHTGPPVTKRNPPSVTPREHAGGATDKLAAQDPAQQGVVRTPWSKAHVLLDCSRLGGWLTRSDG